MFITWTRLRVLVGKTGSCYCGEFPYHRQWQFYQTPASQWLHRWRTASQSAERHMAGPEIIQHSHNHWCYSPINLLCYMYVSCNTKSVYMFILRLGHKKIVILCVSTYSKLILVTTAGGNVESWVYLERLHEGPQKSSNAFSPTEELHQSQHTEQSEEVDTDDLWASLLSKVKLELK